MTANAPIILDMGKTKRKWVRQLKRGQGKLLLDVQDALGEVMSELGEEAEGKQLIPIVLVYRKKRKKKRRGRLWLPFL